MGKETGGRLIAEGWGARKIEWCGERSRSEELRSGDWGVEDGGDWLEERKIVKHTNYNY